MTKLHSRIMVTFMLTAIALAPRAEIIEAIVATVDDEIILRSDLLIGAQAAITELQQSSSTQQEFDTKVGVLLLELLNVQIENKLLMRRALLLGAEVTDADIESRMETIRQDRTLDQFIRFLELDGLTIADVRVRQREYILATRMRATIQRDFNSEVVLSESDVAQYYEDHRAEYLRDEEVLISQILFRASADPADRARATARLETIGEELEAGAEFSEIAKAYSEDMFAEDGGSMGWHQRDRLLLPEIEKAVFALSVGGITPIINTPVGVHLLRVDDRREAGQRTLEEMRGQIERNLSQDAVGERYTIWLADLRKRGGVRIFQQAL